jgi:phosphoserine aminotransferase
MDLFSLLTRWADHIGGQLALQEIDERNADTYYELVWTTKLAALAPKSRSEGSVTMAKAEATHDQDVMAAQLTKDMAYARRKILQVMAGNLERDTQLVSRELSRRLGRKESNENRVGRYRP